MSISPTDRLVTGDELLLQSEWGPCELVRGRVHPVSRQPIGHGFLMNRLSVRLGSFIEHNKLGVMFAGSGIYVARNPDTVRGPDLHFVAAARWPADDDWEGYLDIAPDLCIEIVSRNDHWSELEEKVEQYFNFGVKLVWIIDPKTRKVHVRNADGSKTVIPPTGTLLGENIVPGFELKLSDLFG